MRILVTGGAGFIGSAFIRHVLKDSCHSILNLDKLTYAVDSQALLCTKGNERYQFVYGDICDATLLRDTFNYYQPDCVIHFAAESHVDSSIEKPSEFVQTNIVGTFQLLQASLVYWEGLCNQKKQSFRFIHISTDEVFGDLTSGCSPFNEDSAYNPSSPYSASKASGDHLARAWMRTYQLPVIITNCSNNYGPFQHKEKLIPKIIDNAKNLRALPIYGSGMQVRDWLYVADHVEALFLILRNGKPGETYLIGGNCERSNLDVVYEICGYFDELRPIKDFTYTSLIEHVEDRNGHDFRYSIDSSTTQQRLEWKPQYLFEECLRELVVQAILE